MNIHLTLVSGNAKTGPIPVSATSKDTCPDNCQLKTLNMCYAGFGPLGIHWGRLNNGTYPGLSWKDFIAQVKRFHKGQLWRHNQAGDLAGVNNDVDCVKLAELTDANRGKRGFTYTHKPVLDNAKNASAIKAANANGFTINLSADSVKIADTLKALQIGPVAVIVGQDVTKNFLTPQGNRVVLCPAAVRDNVNCAHCGLCQWAKRDYVIGFPAHGVRKKALTALATA